MIKETELYQKDPFQFRLFPGSLSCNKKGLSAPVLMVEVERDQVLMGLDFFAGRLMEKILCPHVGYPTHFLPYIRISSPMTTDSRSSKILTFTLMM